jgi:hypothetical protein
MSFALNALLPDKIAAVVARRASAPANPLPVAETGLQI